MRVTKESRQNAVDYGMKSIRYICEEIGPREPGMPNERAAQEWLKGQIDQNGWADETTIENFTVSRHALVGFTKIIGVLLIIGALLQFLNLLQNSVLSLVVNVTSLAFAVISLLITVLEFLFYVPLIDRFLPKSESCNVYARLKPTGEVKRRIIINGHTDSAYEWTLMKIRQEVMVGVLAVDLICVIASIIIFSINLARGCVPVWTLGFVGFTIIAYIGLFFVCTFKHLSPGANDNLTGVFVAVGALKALKESGIRYENTEVCAILTGSEEAGLRGATAWAKKHKDDDDVETYIIAFDTMRDMEHMTIYERDMTMLVKNDADVVALLDEACKDPDVNHPLKHGGVPFGASDAAGFTRGGFKAAAVAGQNPKYAPYYHNRRDTPDELILETFALGLDVALAAIEAFDKK